MATNRNNLVIKMYTTYVLSLLIFMMMAAYLQARIFEKVDGQFLHAHWWLRSLILDVHTLMHFGQTKFGLRMTDMLIALSASCVFPLRLHTSLPQTYDWLFFSLEYQLLWSEASCCRN